MSQDSQDFETLRRLLALKRYEQPPPGYFHNFSFQVIARIEAGEGARENVLERLFWDAPWLQRLWTALETKPIMAGALGAAVCALLVAGVVYPERPAGQPIAYAPATPPPLEIANNGAAPAHVVFPTPTNPHFVEQPEPAEAIAFGSPAESLLKLVPRGYAVPASFNLPGSN
jgi:hypothetical protein